MKIAGLTAGDIHIPGFGIIDDVAIEATAKALLQAPIFIAFSILPQKSKPLSFSMVLSSKIVDIFCDFWSKKWAFPLATDWYL